MSLSAFTIVHHEAAQEQGLNVPPLRNCPHDGRHMYTVGDGSISVEGSLISISVYPKGDHATNSFFVPGKDRMHLSYDIRGLPASMVMFTREVGVEKYCHTAVVANHSLYYNVMRKVYRRGFTPGSRSGL